MSSKVWLKDWLIVCSSEISRIFVSRRAKSSGSNYLMTESISDNK